MAICENLLRRFILMRFLFGMKPLRKTYPPLIPLPASGRGIRGG